MDLTCPKCGSAEVVPDVPVVSRVTPLSALQLSALAYRNPTALLFKKPVAHPLSGRVCGACGFIEFYVSDPQGLATVIRRAETAS